MIMKKDLLSCTTLGDNEGETRGRDDTVGGMETSAQGMALHGMQCMPMMPERMTMPEEMMPQRV